MRRLPAGWCLKSINSAKRVFIYKRKLRFFLSFFGVSIYCEDGFSSHQLIACSKRGFCVELVCVLHAFPRSLKPQEKSYTKAANNVSNLHLAFYLAFPCFFSLSIVSVTHKVSLYIIQFQ